MNAGRELDVIIGEKVMDFPGCDNCGEKTGCGCAMADIGSSLPQYSTDLYAAWLVVEKLREKYDGHFSLLAFTTNWRAGWDTPCGEDPTRSFKRFVEAPTAPLAICLAALEVVGYKHS